MLKIDDLSVGNYRDHMTVSDLYQIKPKWMEKGYHHISTACFRNAHFVAVDGIRRDKYLNTFFLGFFKAFVLRSNLKVQHVKTKHK